MDLGIAGQVAVVAGATKGIGFACALALAKEGARVAIFARDRGRLEAAAERIAAESRGTCRAYEGDLRDGESIKSVFRQVREDMGPTQILVANSVGPSPGGFEIGTDEAWLAAFEGAFLSAARMVREAIPQMLEAGGGSVVAVQSSAVKQPIVDMTLSNGVRPGVAGLMKSLTQQYSKVGLRFNVVCPGRIRTDRFLSVEKSHGGDFEQRIQRMASEVPMQRLGTAEEVADAIVYLSSARASYITGSVLAVDGGNVRSLY